MTYCRDCHPFLQTHAARANEGHVDIAFLPDMGKRWYLGITLDGHEVGGAAFAAQAGPHGWVACYSFALGLTNADGRPVADCHRHRMAVTVLQGEVAIRAITRAEARGLAVAR